MANRVEAVGDQACNPMWQRLEATYRIASTWASSGAPIMQATHMHVILDEICKAKGKRDEVG